MNNEGEPLHSDRSAWNVVDFANEHARDINDSTLKRHLPTPGTAGNIARDDGTNWQSVELVAYVPFAPTARGDLIAANTTPTWARLALSGSTGSIFTRDANDPVWSSYFISGAAGETLTFNKSLTLTGVNGRSLTLTNSLVVQGGGTTTLSSSGAYTLTIPKTGTAVIGTGTISRIAEWVTDANTIQASTLIKSGAGVLTLSAGGAYTLTIPETGTTALLATTNIFTAKQTIADSATISPLNITERSAAPSSPASNDIYLDDGTNTASTSPGWRRYTGAAWEDMGAVESSIAALGAHASRVTTQTIATSWGDDYVTFTSEVLDQDSYFDLGGQPTRFTIPDTGWYVISGYVIWDNAAASKSIGIHRNRTEMLAQERSMTGGAGEHTSIGGVFYLTSGNYVELYVSTEFGDDLETAHFYIARI
ncbi:hypothetical protein LCGC14_0609640 [marine sediment metagenome]|uniref:C1q domain-containing protein n=1 Tax=marine sediment metagenome TaxID=412755 RepID=A0A0F9RS94_9ZZZZ